MMLLRKTETSGAFERKVSDTDFAQREATVVDTSENNFAIGNAFHKVFAVGRNVKVSDAHPDNDADNIFIDPDKSKDSEKNWMDTSSLSNGADFFVNANDCYNEEAADNSVGSSVPNDDVISLSVADQRIADLEDISTPCSVHTPANQFTIPENKDFDHNQEFAELSEICDNRLILRRLICLKILKDQLRLFTKEI
ncbi:unnamed protein product [Ambrosiozyma monospora]|uniref:Unnamed protein product n=1 Tax=Ambrosiozyma monospora TaxID=43982 RepID=A0ACB5U3P7_AMBMO|nr:unnamed protein product [Ambrosiozyma monospora]